MGVSIGWVDGNILYLLASEIFRVTDDTDRSHYHNFRKMYIVTVTVLCLYIN